MRLTPGGSIDGSEKEEIMELWSGITLKGADHFLCSRARDGSEKSGGRRHILGMSRFTSCGSVRVPVPPPVQKRIAQTA